MEGSRQEMTLLHDLQRWRAAERCQERALLGSILILPDSYCSAQVRCSSHGHLDQEGYFAGGRCATPARTASHACSHSPLLSGEEMKPKARSAFCFWLFRQIPSDRSVPHCFRGAVFVRECFHPHC